MRMLMRSLLFTAVLATACLGFSQKKTSGGKPSAAKPAAAAKPTANKPAAASGIDVEHSSITVHVLRAGVFGFTGDNHEVNAPISKGKLDEAGGSIEFEVETAKMKVLDPKMDPAKRAQVQEKMLGPEVLDSAHYPLIEFSSTSVKADKIGHWTVTGNLKLHGTLRPVTLAVTGPPDEVGAAGAKAKVRHYQGSTTLKQSVFGIKPISVAGGTVKVRDELKIDFDIVAR